jgi:hypothetical protein
MRSTTADGTFDELVKEVTIFPGWSHSTHT